MTDLLSNIEGTTFVITLNRVDKHNAFDNALLHALQIALDDAIANPHIRAILLRANGPHFSAGADLGWMQRMANYSEEENLADAMVLAKVMQTLNQSPKPTIAAIQGAAIGGGAGLVAACDIAIASTSARFCFSEVKLGLIPAVISPYVIKAIGERAAKWLFMSAESVDAIQAKELQLIHHVIEETELWPFSTHYANNFSQLAPEAITACKSLVNYVSTQPIGHTLSSEMAALIAKKRVSQEGQYGLNAFLNKETPNWS